MGEVAQELVCWQGRGLSLVKVYQELFDIAKTRGTLDKVMRLINLLTILMNLQSKAIVLGLYRTPSKPAYYLLGA